MADLACNECGHKWSREPDSDGLFDDYGCPPCPNCFSGNGLPASNYGDFVCNTCGHEFRRYGNGGLRFGMIPRCPECGGYCSEK